jgi:hypothetical protein
MSLSSHASDGATVATSPWCNADAESCQLWCCRVLLATALPRPIGDGVAEATLVVA